MGKDQELIEAARNGKIGLVRKLLDQIAKRSGPLSSFRRSPSINGQDMNGYTPLHHACLNGHVDITRLLLAHEAKPDVPDIRGSTPLYLAAWAGQMEIVKMLLMHARQPANPNIQTTENETPLHCAAQHGHNAALGILLTYGADPTIRNNSFQTALDLAAQFGRLQAVQILLRSHPELIAPFRLKDASAESSSAAATPPYSSTHTAPKHIFTHTCLHLASRNGHKKVVEALLAAGVDVNILTHAGSALHEAALCGKKSVVSTLLHAGINIGSTDGAGRTAFDLLKDFPPHVTYEIVSVINDFCKNANPAAGNYLMQPIEGAETDMNDADASGLDENANCDDFDRHSNSIRDKSHSMPKPSFVQKHKASGEETAVYSALANRDPMPKHFKPSDRLSSSMSSLEKTSGRNEFYLKMKPIVWKKSTTDLGSLRENIPTAYRPMFMAYAPNRHEREAPKLPPKPNPSSIAVKTSHSNATRYRRCAEDYVVMTEPSLAREEQSHKNDTKKPLPFPRHFSAVIVSDGEDTMHAITSTSSITNTHGGLTQRVASPTNANNNNKYAHVKRDFSHSSSPEFPPPSVLQAERTILELIQPSGQMAKQSSYEQDAPSASPHSSRFSDNVEEFVGDAPFAGLFKGSSLNLANGDRNNVGYSLNRTSSYQLRSPSLVKSTFPDSAEGNARALIESNETDAFDEIKGWDEINTILESIGNEVSSGNEPEKPKIIEEAMEDQIEAVNPQESFEIRKPSDLLLGISNNTTNWCHSTNTLIYGQILYNVYYLGSTIVRQLHGTESTRKSIQKLKRESDLDENLVLDCKNSTKYLKANNQQTRLQVGIALSYIGVKYIDLRDRVTICLHDIENINCVCQDLEDLRYFAYITKENEDHYCHVFMVDHLQLATEIILTLGQAFEVAYQLTLIKNRSSRTRCIEYNEAA